MKNQKYTQIISRIFSINIIIFFIGFFLLIAGFLRVNTALNHINRIDDFLYQYGNLGVIYLYIGILILIYLLIKSKLK